MDTASFLPLAMSAALALALARSRLGCGDGLFMPRSFTGDRKDTCGRYEYMTSRDLVKTLFGMYFITARSMLLYQLYVKRGEENKTKNVVRSTDVYSKL